MSNLQFDSKSRCYAFICVRLVVAAWQPFGHLLAVASPRDACMRHNIVCGIVACSRGFFPRATIVTGRDKLLSPRIPSSDNMHTNPNLVLVARGHGPFPRATTPSGGSQDSTIWCRRCSYRMTQLSCMQLILLSRPVVLPTAPLECRHAVEQPRNADPTRRSRLHHGLVERHLGPTPET